MPENETPIQNNEQPSSASSTEPIASEVDSKIAELEKSAQQFKDQFLRKAAEFENYKKRTDSEYLDRIRFANEQLLENLLPVIDDFERSLKMGKGKSENDVFYSGIDLIYQKLLKTLSAQGMKPYDSLGKPFDTAYHDALMQMPKKGVAPHIVIEEVQKGYMLNDKVLRHAKVVVSSEEPPEQTTEQIQDSQKGGG